MNKQVLWVGLGSILAVALAAAAWKITVKPSLHGATIDPPIQAANIRLNDYNNQSFDLASLRGKVVLVYFGYTNCPDECPLTMAHLKLAIDQLGSDAKNVRVVMVTTDPRRDTPQVLKSWLTKFSPDFVGVFGAPDAMAKVWQDYGVTVEDSGATHSYFVYVIDPAGNWRETFLPDAQPADIASDIHMLLAER